MNKYSIYPKLGPLSLMTILLVMASTAGIAAEISTQKENYHHQSTLHEGSIHLNLAPYSFETYESQIFSASLLTSWAPPSPALPDPSSLLGESMVPTTSYKRSYLWGYLYDVEDAWSEISKYFSTTSLPGISYFSSQSSSDDRPFIDPKEAFVPSHSFLHPNDSDESTFGFYLIEDTPDEKEPD